MVGKEQDFDKIIGEFVERFTDLRVYMRRAQIEIGELRELSEVSEPLRRLCTDLASVIELIDEAFTGKKNPIFVAQDLAHVQQWRDYEANFAAQIHSFTLDGALDEIIQRVLQDDYPSKDADAETEYTHKYEEDTYTDTEAIGAALSSAAYWERCDGGEGVNTKAEFAWNSLVKCGVDVDAILKRRQRLPATLIPMDQYASDRLNFEKVGMPFVSLLIQAQDAYVFGAPFAAIALLRAVIEDCLKERARPQPPDGETPLIARIRICENLPTSVKKSDLEYLTRFANRILHDAGATLKRKERLELENITLRILKLTRNLVEGLSRRGERS